MKQSKRDKILPMSGRTDAAHYAKGGKDCCKKYGEGHNMKVHGAGKTYGKK